MHDHVGYVEWKRYRENQAMKPQAIRWAIMACIMVALLAGGLFLKANGVQP